MTTAPNLDAPRLRNSGAAVAALFFVNGATFSNWLPRIPEIRDQLGLGNAGLGATLLGGGLGGIIGALLVGKVIDRLGSRRLLTLVATALSIGMPLIAFAPNAVVLLLLLTTLGRARRVQRRCDERPRRDRATAHRTLDHEPAARDVEPGLHRRGRGRIGRVGCRRKRAKPNSSRLVSSCS